MLYTQSLKKNFQFRRVYNKGRSLANKHLVMYILKSNEEGNKLGISVSKKVGKSVVRSRITRLIRESYRSLEEEVLTGLDIVIIARKEICGVQYADVKKSLRHLLKLHGIIQKEHQG